jgi:hypothetical protein
VLNTMTEDLSYSFATSRGRKRAAWGQLAECVMWTADVLKETHYLRLVNYRMIALVRMREWDGPRSTAQRGGACARP